MAFYEVSPADGGRAKLARTIELVCFALVVAHLVYLTTAYLEGIWLEAPDGNGLPTDFVNVWAAGKLALAGHAAAAYDWPITSSQRRVRSATRLTAISAGIIRRLFCSLPPACRCCLIDRQRGLGLRHLPCLCRGDPRHHWRPRRCPPRRRVSRRALRISLSDRMDSSALVSSAALFFSWIGGRSWPACCLGC